MEVYYRVNQALTAHEDLYFTVGAKLNRVLQLGMDYVIVHTYNPNLKVTKAGASMEDLIRECEAYTVFRADGKKQTVDLGYLQNTGVYNVMVVSLNDFVRIKPETRVELGLVEVDTDSMPAKEHTALDSLAAENQKLKTQLRRETGFHLKARIRIQELTLELSQTKAKLAAARCSELKSLLGTEYGPEENELEQDVEYY